jgi:hypothetical protein
MTIIGLGAFRPPDAFEADFTVHLLSLFWL